MIRLYQETQSTYKTAEILGIDRNIVYRTLRSLNFPMKGKSGPRQENKIKMNETFFSVIDTEEKAYWLGFIAADGCIRKNKSGSHELSIHLAEKDVEHLVAFRKAIQSEHTISVRQNGKYRSAKIQIIRKQMTDDLMKLGIVQNKTFEPFHIPEPFMNHWLRGLFDGDGSFWIRKRPGLKQQIAFSFTCATMQQIELICSIFIANNILGGSVYQAEKNAYHFSFEGNKKVASIVKLLYDNPTIYLERKRLIIEGLI